MFSSEQQWIRLWYGLQCSWEANAIHEPSEWTSTGRLILFPGVLVNRELNTLIDKHQNTMWNVFFDGHQ